jgi:hypothetical protein
MMIFRFLRKKRVHIGDSDRVKRPLSLKHLLKEWSNGVATVLNGRWREPSIIFHKAAEFG